MFIAFPDEKSNLHTFNIENFFLIPLGISRRYTAATALSVGVLMRYAGKKANCWPKLETIGNCLGGVKPSSVYVSLKRPISDGLIRVDHGRYGKNLFTFVWHPYWKDCLAKGADVPRDAAGNELKYGEPFSPHNLLECGFIHESIMGMYPSEMNHGEKVMLGYMYSRIGANGCAWPTMREAGKAVGSHAVTAGIVVQNLIKKNALRKESGSFFGKAYVPVIHKFMMEDMRVQKVEKVKSTILQRLLAVVETEKSSKERASWSSKEADASLLSNYNEDACGEEVVGLEEETLRTESDFLEKIPSEHIRDRARLWLSQITNKLPLATRINIAIQLIHSKVKIKNKGAYAATLIRKAFNGEYVVAGINETIKLFLRWSGSIARQYG